MSDADRDLPKLIKSQTEVQGLIEKQIEKGKLLQSRVINSEEDLRNAEGIREKWEEYNQELLKRFFTNNSIANEYSYRGIPDRRNRVEHFKEEMFTSLARLESIIERLPLIPEINTISSLDDINTKDVFIVHGHDNTARETVASFLGTLNLNPIILHEQPNRGRTIIEKFEEESTSVAFAIVLLTPDDVGASKNDRAHLKSRARQNVILELGYFIGRLGRHNVCPLISGEIEQPSDIFGMVYISMNNNWQDELKREMKAAGLQIE